WEARCMKEVPSAGTAASLALRDSVPTYLDHLSEALASNRRTDFRSIRAHDRESTRIGKMHGADRASNRSYILADVIFEYHILREVLFQVLEADGPLAQPQRDIILDSIEEAVNDAAVEFSEVHADIQEKFINTLTHDLKIPLTTAKMNADMILRSPETSEASSKGAKRIVGSLNRLSAMVHDLLDASRIRAGEPLTLQFTPGDLNAVIREVIEEMSTIHGDRFRLESPGAIQGDWDLDALRRVVENLIANAVKYGSPEKPITISLRSDTKSVVLMVHNEGQPIAESEIPLLFEQFRRSKSAQEGTKAGWGLGLTLIKGVVDAHRGEVRVESSAEKGTSFILEIPLDQPSRSGDLKIAG
ncbi:MAG: sensor histidine kinase, partial [Bdellovibrionota bacterium]